LAAEVRPIVPLRWPDDWHRLVQGGRNGLNFVNMVGGVATLMALWACDHAPACASDTEFGDMDDLVAQMAGGQIGHWRDGRN